MVFFWGVSNIFWQSNWSTSYMLILDSLQLKRHFDESLLSTFARKRCSDKMLIMYFLIPKMQEERSLTQIIMVKWIKEICLVVFIDCLPLRQGLRGQDWTWENKGLYSIGVGNCQMRVLVGKKAGWPKLSITSWS